MFKITTLSNLQQMSGWIQPGNVGNDGGGSSAPHGVFTLHPGSPALVKAAGAIPWDNGYFYNQMGDEFSTCNLFFYGGNLMLPTAADLAACQALEWETQMSDGICTYNMAWQADCASKTLRPFDFINKKWLATNIPLGPYLAAGQPMKVLGTFLRDPTGKTLTHVSLSLNGDLWPINLTQPANPLAEKSYLNVAVQVDSNGLTPPTPYSLQLSDWSLTSVQTS